MGGKNLRTSPNLILLFRNKTAVFAGVRPSGARLLQQFLRQTSNCRQYIDTQIYFPLMNKQVLGPLKLAIIGGSAAYLLLIVDG
ncbi:hypothetical protein ACV36C_35735, partial [Pseudomonas aeruginosa]